MRSTGRDYVVGVVLGGAFILVLSMALGLAQTSPIAPGAAPPCDAELLKTQDQVVQLRKGKAQAEYQAAAVEEIALNFQKEVKTLQAKVATLEKAAALPASPATSAVPKIEPKK